MSDLIERLRLNQGEIFGPTMQEAADEIERLQRENEELRKQLAALKSQLAEALAKVQATEQKQAEANLACKNLQNGLLMKEANLEYFAEKNKELRKLLRKASGDMSYGHWSSDFRNQVERALK